MSKRILDEATKKMLEGLAPFSSQSQTRISPDFYTKVGVNAEFIPVFTIRGLTTAEAGELDILVQSVNKEKAGDWNNRAYDLVRKTLVGWENVFDIGTGEELVYISEGGSCASVVFDLLPVNNKSWLFSHIMKLHGLLDVNKLGLVS
jgi:hypothetical protein